MSKRMWPVGLAILILALAAFGLCGCRLALLHDVRISPARITPNADGDTDVARIEYRLRRSAYVSIYFQDEAGNRYVFRDQRRRARSGSRPYSVDFGGVIEVTGERHGEATVRARVLHDGSYTFVVEATDDHGHTESVRLPFQVTHADTTLPELQGFAASDAVFSPNRDGVQDRVKINYYLTKPATVQVYLQDEQGLKYPIPERQGALTTIEPGALGPHVYDYEGGVDQGAQPPPDGTYTLVGLAQDRVGQKVELTRTLTIADGGVPRATIVQLDLDYSHSIVALGDTLCITATVENYGDAPVRTTGPAPGTVYTSEQNFNSLGWNQSSGAWRFGLDFDGNPAYPYPFRWAVGRLEELEKRVIEGETFYYLMPGQRAQVVGCVHILSAPPRNPTVFYGGLIHEDVSVVNDQADPLWITFDVPATGSWNRSSP
ncbi:MAG: hypothetical protein ACOYZ7_12780 [Chloroflexota bacterium]